MPWVRPCVLGACVLVSASAAAKPSLMPLTRVRLYETGVGYFERTGAVGANAVTLPVPASHLDDALKTLVVLSEGGAARLGGVEFASSVTPGMGRALAGASSDGEPLNLTALLGSLKGASVVVSLAHEKLEGRIVDVLDGDASDLEACLPSGSGEDADCEPTKVPSLVVMTKTHDLRRVALGNVTGVRPTDPAVAARLNAALDALSGGAARVLKELRVLAQGKRVTLGYVGEAPVWRASYRLVLGDAKSAVLQGWALLHNDTDEAWHGVTVELVNGRPDSYLFPLAAPRYARRELVTPDNELSAVPQLMRTTPDALWNVDGDDDSSSGGLGLSGIGEGGGGRGEGIGLGSIGTLGHGGANTSDDSSSLLSVGNLAAIAPSEGVESGSLFRYTLGDKLDLRAHGSALVPFIGEGVEARRVALFARPEASARSAVYVTHRGAQTLPAGTLAVFDHGFAGEAALPRLKPNETTTAEFGSELDVSLSESAAAPRDEPRAVRFENWHLVEHYIRHHELSEHLENKSGEPRSVFMGLHYVNNANVQGADELVYDTRNTRAYAVFTVAPTATSERTLTVTEGLARSYPVRELTIETLMRLAKSPSLPERQRATLRLAEVALEQAAAKRRELHALEPEIARHEADARRYREHAEALGAARGTDDVVARLLAAEDRAEALRGTARRLKSEADILGRRCTNLLLHLDR